MLSDRVVNTRSLGSNISELGKIGTSNLYCGGAVHCFFVRIGRFLLGFPGGRLFDTMSCISSSP